MHLIQKRSYLFIWLIFIIVASVVPIASAAEEAIGAATEIPKPSHYLVATYFYNTFRCPTCRKLEEFSEKSVQNNFADNLKNGTIVWRVVNVDEPENQHYNKDYQLYTKSLIISEVRDGKEVRWKNLEKIWTLVRDEEKFEEYVKSEIDAWMKDI